jgi:pimeloyl-ACP methyl ester carboxylesterase
MWTAVSLWALLAGGATLYVVWAQGLAAQGVPVPPLVAGAALVYLAAYAFMLGVYLALAWRWRAPRPRRARIGLAPTLRLVADEYRSLVASSWRMMFFRALVRDPPPAPAARPVLLVHGVLCNAGVWSAFARRLAARGVRPVYALSYGPTLASIETFADQLAAKIDAILAATGAAQVIVVSHSMGGLVTLAYCRRHGAAKLRRLIALGAPFHGSVHAWLFPGACLAQLRPGNAWLAALHRARFARPPIHSIWSWHDTMVAPQTSSRLAGADESVLAGVGHTALVGDEAAGARVLALIEADEASAPRAAATSGSPA